MNKESITLLKNLLTCANIKAIADLKDAEIADTYHHRGWQQVPEVKNKIKLIRETYIELENYEL